MRTLYIIAICSFLSSTRSLVLNFSTRKTSLRVGTFYCVPLEPCSDSNNARQTDDDKNLCQSFPTRASYLGIKDVTRRHAFVLSAVCASQLVSPARSVGAYNDEEAKRIAIFEKTSPSVVFIDTFAERRDVFSTNILEGKVSPGEQHHIFAIEGRFCLTPYPFQFLWAVGVVSFGIFMATSSPTTTSSEMPPWRRSPSSPTISQPCHLLLLLSPAVAWRCGRACDRLRRVRKGSC
jgi:hypothetical protein